MSLKKQGRRLINLGIALGVLPIVSSLFLLFVFYFVDLLTGQDTSGYGMIIALALLLATQALFIGASISLVGAVVYGVGYIKEGSDPDDATSAMSNAPPNVRVMRSLVVVALHTLALFALWPTMIYVLRWVDGIPWFFTALFAACFVLGWIYNAFRLVKDIQLWLSDGNGSWCRSFVQTPRSFSNPISLPEIFSQSSQSSHRHQWPLSVMRAKTTRLWILLLALLPIAPAVFQ